MKVVIFCGPTLATGEAARVPGAEVRPPAMRGDVLAAALERPDVIALIDGYFDRVPSVWHKEILWAMSEGIHVFGASSMGALRAAELATFGMQGVGTIFESYRDGRLQDDDEVTIAHASDDLGYRPLSDAMVNIRATLGAAQRSGLITDSEERRLVAIAKALPYWDRSYPMLLRKAQPDVAANSLRALTAWLEHGRVDQKLLDARLLVSTIVERAAELAVPLKVHFRFAHSDAWQRLYQEVSSRLTLAGEALSDDRLAGWLDELLVRGVHGATLDAALARALSAGELPRLGPVNDRSVESIVDEFRRERGLYEPERFTSWLAEQGLEAQASMPFFRAEAELRRARAVLGPRLAKYVIDQLRADGRFADVSQRASLKRQVLERRGLDLATLHDLKLTEPELWSWYFERCRHAPLPSALAIYAASERVDLERLRQAILREYCYVRASE